MSNPDDPGSWIEKAGNDLQCIRNNVNAAVVPWDIIAYHAQQAAEKALKAALVSRSVVIPRTHDLGRLLGDCLAAGLKFELLEEQCHLLTPYAVASRYPGDEPDVTQQDALAAYDAAQQVVNAVVDTLRSK